MSHLNDFWINVDWSECGVVSCSNTRHRHAAYLAREVLGGQIFPFNYTGCPQIESESFIL